MYLFRSAHLRRISFGALSLSAGISSAYSHSPLFSFVSSATAACNGHLPASTSSTSCSPPEPPLPVGGVSSPRDLSLNPLFTAAIRNFDDLEAAILSNGCTNARPPFNTLRASVEQFGEEHFFDSLLPFIIAEATLASHTLPTLPFLTTPSPSSSPSSSASSLSASELTLTQRDCVGVLCCAFLCAFPNRTTVWSHTVEECASLCSINFDSLHANADTRKWVGKAPQAKLLLFLHYFETLRAKIHDEPAFSGLSVSFHRRTAFHPASAPSASPADPEIAAVGRDWRGAEGLVGPMRLHALGESITEGGSSMLRIDFANKFMGGGVLGSGAVQEEIMFTETPELCVGRLFCPVLRDDESMHIIGASKMTESQGYGRSLAFHSVAKDSTPLSADGTTRLSFVAVIDAINFKRLDEGPNVQYRPAHVKRELNKIWSAVCPLSPQAQPARCPPTSLCPTLPTEVATGNWGCGVFGGDPMLKSLIQLAACSQASREMHYFPWDDQRLEALPRLVARMRQRKTTVGELCTFLLERVRVPEEVGESVFCQLDRDLDLGFASRL